MVHGRHGRRSPSPPPGARQVYKALLGGVQPVAVKVIPFDASDKERADFDKEVRRHNTLEPAHHALMGHTRRHVSTMALVGLVPSSMALTLHLRSGDSAHEAGKQAQM
jgi:hypothetical protein